jgi:hypothetical protein
MLDLVDSPTVVTIIKKHVNYYYYYYYIFIITIIIIIIYIPFLQIVDTF